MKIADTSLLCTLALKSLDETIAPELQSSAAMSAAGLIREALRALVRRNDAGAALLHEINRDGAQIVEELHAALSEHGVAFATEGPQSAGNRSGFEDSAKLNGESTARLATLVSTFSRKVPLSKRKPSDAFLLRRAAEWECRSNGALATVAAATNTEPPAVPLPRAALEAFIQSVHPDGAAATVASLDRVSGGFGKQTYLLTVTNAAGFAEQLVVRKDDKVPVCDHRSFDLEREFQLVQAVNRSGFPAPLPQWFSRRAAEVDAPFYIVQRAPGRAVGSFLGGAAQLPEGLALEFAQLLAKLHQMPLENFREVIERFDDPIVFTETVEQGYRRHLADWRHYAETAETLPSPLMAYLFDWLENNVPKDQGKPVLVHGDYNIHNVLADEGHISAVLDWEAAMFGAPGIDLAYVRLGLAKHIDWPTFMAHYLACGGRPVDEATLGYHLAFQAMKIMVAMISIQHLMLCGRHDDIRMTSMELGFVPQFMQIALASTADPISKS